MTQYGRITFDVALTDDADPAHVVEHNLNMLRGQCYVVNVDGAGWDGAIVSLKGWTGDSVMLEHLDKHGVLDEAEQLMDEDAAGIDSESISAEEFLEVLRAHLPIPSESISADEFGEMLKAHLPSP